LAEDFFFYWSHWALHHPKLYKIIHKKHHEYTSPFTITAEYSSVTEYFFGNIIPSAIGLKILAGKSHIFTMWFWVAWRMYATSEAHSGFEFPWSPVRILPLSGSALFHNYHHSHNDGAFGSFFTFWDHFMKTDISFYQYRTKHFARSLLNKNKF
jgi:sterol desaturase/sphingolipid hydroxylase (fatty acid hydroxylase superfamily)